MKLIIGTGSRNWREITSIRKVISSIFDEFGKTEWEYYHGAAQGFDSYSDFILRQNKFTAITPFPAHWNLYSKAAWLLRNQEMLSMGLTKYSAGDILVIAMPLTASKGTWDMVKRSKKADVAVRVYNEKGSLV